MKTKRRHTHGLWEDRGNRRRAKCHVFAHLPPLPREFRKFDLVRFANSLSSYNGKISSMKYPSATTSLSTRAWSDRIIIPQFCLPRSFGDPEQAGHVDLLKGESPLQSSFLDIAPVNLSSLRIVYRNTPTRIYSLTFFPTSIPSLQRLIGAHSATWRRVFI